MIILPETSIDSTIDHSRPIGNLSYLKTPVIKGFIVDAARIVNTAPISELENLTIQVCSEEKILELLKKRGADVSQGENTKCFYHNTFSFFKEICFMGFANDLDTFEFLTNRFPHEFRHHLDRKRVFFSIDKTNEFGDEDSQKSIVKEYRAYKNSNLWYDIYNDSFLRINYIFFDKFYSDRPLSADKSHYDSFFAANFYFYHHNGYPRHMMESADRVMKLYSDEQLQRSKKVMEFCESFELF